MSAPRKVRPGDPLNIPAPTWNALLTMLRQYGPGSVEAARGVQRQLPTGLAVVKNLSGLEFQTGYVTWADASVPVIPTPTDDLDGFRSIPAIPVSAPQPGRIMIIAEPIPVQGIGKAWVSGLAVAKVNITEARRPYADKPAGLKSFRRREFCFDKLTAGRILAGSLAGDGSRAPS